MPKKRYTPAQIVAKLRQVDVALAQGPAMVQVVKAIAVVGSWEGQGRAVHQYRWLAPADDGVQRRPPNSAKFRL